MFSDFMMNTWTAGTLVALVAGVVGFFVVLRGMAFAAHAIPNGAFAGAAGAIMLGVDPLAGLVVFAVGSAILIAVLGRRVHNDVATALAIVLMLALGIFFLSRTEEYAQSLFGYLFGSLLGVSQAELTPLALMAILGIVGTACLYRPLLLSSVAPDLATVRRIKVGGVETIFLVVVALATTIAVPVVGALLIFSLLLAPAATAAVLSNRPPVAMAMSVGFALGTIWCAIALAYETNLPIGFFVGSIGAGIYIASRLMVSLRGRLARPRVVVES